MREACSGLCDEVRGARAALWTLFAHECFEIQAVDVLHDNVGQVSLFADVLDSHDVLMVKLCERPRLQPEPVQVRGVLHQ